MGVRDLLRSAGIPQDERRRSPRTRCRLPCSVHRGRRRTAARVMDVSEGGLCILSPVSFAVKQPLQIQIQVPQRGPVDVEAIAWHVRRVRSGTSGRKAFSIGLMITKVGEGFEALLPGTGAGLGNEAAQKLARTLQQMSKQQATMRGSGTACASEPELDARLEEDALSPEELEALEVELLSPAELDSLARTTSPERGAGYDAEDVLQLFRVRVKELGGARTRTLTFGAGSESEATTLARTELGTDWQILEVREA